MRQMLARDPSARRRLESAAPDSAARVGRVHRGDDQRGHHGGDRIRDELGLAGPRATVQLRSHRGPRRVGIGAMQVDAAHAGSAARPDEGADVDAAVAEDDREMRDVAAQPGAVPRRLDRVRTDDHGQCRRLDQRIAPREAAAHVDALRAQMADDPPGRPSLAVHDDEWSGHRVDWRPLQDGGHLREESID